MPESLASELPESVSFDPSDREAWRNRIRQLPRRAVVAFALRCLKRSEPLVCLGHLKAYAYSSGFDLNALPSFGWKCANYADAANVVYAADYADAATDMIYVRDPDSASAIAAYADLQKLLGLSLGKAGKPGEPIRWNDTRLGPLWPDGPPEWYVQAEQACRELEDQLRNLPDLNAPPADQLLVAQLEDWAWLDQLRNEGKLDQYRGEYVFAAEKQIFGHGRNLMKLRPPAEEEAKAKGIPPERLVDYFIPGE